MALQKRGTGEVLKDEDVKKTASADETPEDREKRMAALEEENKEVDG